MRNNKTFVFKESDLTFVVRTENEVEEFFLSPYRNEVEYTDFEEALKDYQSRVKEYSWETHELVIVGKDKGEGVSFTLTIQNTKKNKVTAGINIKIEALDSEAMEKLKQIGEIVRSVI